jgi:hypothetical protein
VQPHARLGDPALCRSTRPSVTARGAAARCGSTRRGCDSARSAAAARWRLGAVTWCGSARRLGAVTRRGDDSVRCDSARWRLGAVATRLGGRCGGVLRLDSVACCGSVAVRSVRWRRCGRCGAVAVRWRCGGVGSVRSGGVAVRCGRLGAVLRLGAARLGAVRCGRCGGVLRLDSVGGRCGGRCGAVGAVAVRLGAAARCCGSVRWRAAARLCRITHSAGDCTLWVPGVPRPRCQSDGCPVWD